MLVPRHSVDTHFFVSFAPAHGRFVRPPFKPSSSSSLSRSYLSPVNSWPCSLAIATTSSADLAPFNFS